MTRPTTLRVSSTVLLRWIRDHAGEDFRPSMVVIANDWTTQIVWAQLCTLLHCPPFLDAPEPLPSQALLQSPRALSFIHSIPVSRPSPLDDSVGRYGLTALGAYYLAALENPDAAQGPYLLMALKHPEIESPEALAIYDKVPVWKKILGWLNVVGAHVALRRERLRHALGRFGEHIVYTAVVETLLLIFTGHELVWWIAHLLHI